MLKQWFDYFPTNNWVTRIERKHEAWKMKSFCWMRRFVMLAHSWVCLCSILPALIYPFLSIFISKHVRLIYMPGQFLCIFKGTISPQLLLYYNNYMFMIYACQQLTWVSWLTHQITENYISSLDSHTSAGGSVYFIYLRSNELVNVVYKQKRNIYANRRDAKYSDNRYFMNCWKAIKSDCMQHCS